MSMMEEQLVEVHEESAIKNILVSMASEKSKILLWQPVHSGKRVESEASLIRFLPDKKEIIFVPTNEPFAFDNTTQLYCVARGNTVLFKQEIFHNSSYKLIINSPTSIMIRDKRSEPRTVLFDDNISLEYHYGEATFEVTEKFPFRSKIVDISEGGLSFLSRLENVQRFRPGDQLSLRLPFETNRVINGRVCYISSVKAEDKKLLSRVGIQFSL